jgi:hypothetical protein
LCGGIASCSIGYVTSDPPICKILFIYHAFLGMK